MPFSNSFFKPFLISALKCYGCETNRGVPVFLQNKDILRATLHNLQVYEPGRYTHDHFTHWLSAYAKQSPATIRSYLDDKIKLIQLCRSFIHFCFAGGIALDKEKTLQSFSSHDALSTEAVKKELQKLKSKDEIRLLGFGLGDGAYEKEIAQYIIQLKLAKSVKLYGFDPFAAKTDDIEFLTSTQLAKNILPQFDLITARWVLHHVDLQQRWSDLINCINRSQHDAMVLVIEHGILPSNVQLFDKKIYYLLNATFDVVANIGIRPKWFTSTAPDIGANFFIHYLQLDDLAFIKSSVAVKVIHSNMYDVGPKFPNQTICCLRIQA